MILAIRTDKPEAEIYLYSKDGQLVDSYKWQAHRELSVTILSCIDKVLEKNKLKISDIKGLAVYSGPGSFTGLRIGITVANTLAYCLNLPIVSLDNAQWQSNNLQELFQKMHKQIILPQYGSDVRISQPKK